MGRTADPSSITSTRSASCPPCSKAMRRPSGDTVGEERGSSPVVSFRNLPVLVSPKYNWDGAVTGAAAATTMLRLSGIQLKPAKLISFPDSANTFRGAALSGGCGTIQISEAWLALLVAAVETASFEPSGENCR